jgi:hypothetical protein
MRAAAHIRRSMELLTTAALLSLSSTLPAMYTRIGLGSPASGRAAAARAVTRPTPASPTR